ncbi:MAG: phospholipase effector Tle1 domain-containing protein [Advenella sp.]|uniref:phospholipase effector Tle1 domain-containing protein n=1 Tax=Advenella sp. TaxID=1872388 RepID=UPI003F982244
MRTRPRSIFPAFRHLILVLAGMLHFAPEAVAGQANIAQCVRPANGTGHPCRSNNPFTLGAIEPAINSGAGNPVNLATGNKYQETIDLPLRHDGLLVMRSYNAMDRADRGLGVGWRHNFDINLQRTPDGLQITQADGSRILFGRRAGKAAPAAIPAHGRLVIADSGWDWHWPDGSTITFDRQGLLTRLNVDGRHLQIQRHSRASIFADRIRQVTSDAGHALVFHYIQDDRVHARARLTRIDTPQGPIQYRYDLPAGRLMSASRADGSQTLYLYEEAYQAGDPYKLTGMAIVPHHNRNAGNNIAAGAMPALDIPVLRTAIPALAGRSAHVASLSDPLLPQSFRLRTWQYDQSGKVIRAVLHDQPVGPGTQLFNYGVAGTQRSFTRVTDGNGQHTGFVWRRIHGRYLLESVKGHGCIGCAAPGLQAAYDEQGRLSYINGLYIARHPNGMPARLSLPQGFWPDLQLHYDRQGRGIFWSSTLTGSQRIQYNSKGQPTTQIFANGVHWSYEYDAQQRLRTLRQATLPASASGQDPDRTASAVATTTLHYTEDDGFSLTHANETQVHAMNRASGALRTRISRPPSTNNPYQVFYEDIILRHPQTGQVIQLLPEGGRLLYTYTPGQRLRSIVWEDARQQQHPVLQIAAAGHATFGNQVRMQYRQDDFGRQQLHLVARAGTSSRPILGLERLVAGSGRVLKEDYYYPAVASAVRRYYFYGRQQRLAGMTEQHYLYTKGQLSHTPVASGKRRVWYAWDRSGASIARFDGHRTQRSRIMRDASGLPMQVDRLDTRYGVNRRLNEVYRQGRRIQQNLHNGQGHRIARRDPQAFTHFYYQDNRVIGHWSVPTGAPLRAPSNGAISRRYIYAGAIAVAFIEYARPAAFSDGSQPADLSIQSALRRLLSDRSAGTLHFIHTDTQGLPLAVTDGQAQPVWLAQPEPEGKMTPLISRVQLPLRYPGQYEDEATGWFDNIYRTYDPAFGHYLEPDPIGPVPGADPLGYAAAQPRRYVDPLGLLLFAFDGTRNQGSNTNSNVYKLQKLYDSGPVHYIGGPGTNDGLSAFAEPAVYGAANPLQSPYIMGPLGVLLRPADAMAGESVAGIVRTQMHRLIDTLLRDAQSLRNANGHIPIDVIGFSRGAAAARIFANQILQQTRDGLFSARVHTPFANNGQTPDAFTTVSACLDLRFMGLFDTVTQLGVLGSNNAAYNYQVSPAWQWVAHAVALNEYTNIFPLTSIGDSEHENFYEVGFMGNHSDMGGSIQTADKTHVANASGLPGDLGNVTLQWMYQQGRAAGVTWRPLPRTALRIRNPLVHNNLMRYKWQDPARETLAPDREMEGADRASIRQHQSARVGRARRMQVEQFIERDLPQTRPLTIADLFYGNMMAVPPGKEKTLVSQPIVGRADIQAYARWLRETTGFELQTGQVW